MINIPPPMSSPPPSKRPPYICNALPGHACVGSSMVDRCSYRFARPPSVVRRSTGISVPRLTS